MIALRKPEKTFCEAPFCADLSGLTADVAVFGAPHGTPYEPGVASHAAGGGDAVRGALAWFSTYTAGRDHYDFDAVATGFGGASIADCGNVAGELDDGAANRAAIKQATADILARSSVPLLLGGDDSVPIPFIGAFGEAGFENVTIVQVDAHIDWRDEVHGESLGFSSTMRRSSEMAHITNIVQIGARGPGSARQGEVDAAKKWGAHLYTARDVHAKGIAPALQLVPEGSDVILAIDVDGIDPSLVPGVILPAFGGLNYQQMLDVIHGTAARARIIGAAFVEYVPDRDPTGYGAQAIARLASNVIAAIGKQRTK
ncbi:MAG: arginase family protein [Fimbriimonadaceae bacterium]|nr:arginase family protein [Alphaproteobacteria bacterium]